VRKLAKKDNIAKKYKMKNENLQLKLIRQKDEFSKELEDRIEIGNQLYEQEILNQKELNKLIEDYENWDDYNSELLKNSFNIPENEHKLKYDKSTEWLGIDDVVYGKYNPDNPEYKLKETRRDISKKLQNLKQLVQKINLIPSDDKNENDNKDSEISKNNVFIIHGHDESSLYELKSIIKDDFNLNPFILKDLPNKGSTTLIEKFELYAPQCSLAIALFTPDDIIKKDTKQYLQARPNVIYELGWFSAKLTRENVILILKEGTDIFSDFQGIMQLRYKDKVSNIYRELNRELKNKKML
jgi:predicted nucleotide-binding protein